MEIAPRFRPAFVARRCHLFLMVGVVLTNPLLSSALVTNVACRSRGSAWVFLTSSELSPSVLMAVNDDDDGGPKVVLGGQSAAETSTANGNPRVDSLKRSLFELSDRTDRGFRASSSDRRLARTIIDDLARFNPTPEPARDYYEPSSQSPRNRDDAGTTDSERTISGKWTLIYTDAPDITGLDSRNSPLSTAKLGRIGQECAAPYIKNVIEWLRPDWAEALPFSGSDRSRILQKVVTSASATPTRPLLVDLRVAGLELENGNSSGGDGSQGSADGSGGNLDLWTQVQTEGLPAGWLSMNPIDLKGPFNPPFGQFEVLYLDDDVRIIRTGQNFLAANRRIKSAEDEWF